MEIVTWENKTFNEIPKQDNPAFSIDECIMIVKDSQTPSLFCVLEIKGQFAPRFEGSKDMTLVERVLHLGKFWTLENANIFANAFIQTDKDSGDNRCSK
jgi:hypothetical protein